MTTQLAVTAIEESTYIVTAAFVDEDGDAVTPQTVIWSLTDIEGTVINSLEDISETPATTVNIVLTGDDLGVVATGRMRVVTVEATYNSTYGTGLKLKGAATFAVENLVKVT
jgi:hypothetical protein